MGCGPILCHSIFSQKPGSKPQPSFKNWSMGPGGDTQLSLPVVYSLRLDMWKKLTNSTRLLEWVWYWTSWLSQQIFALNFVWCNGASSRKNNHTNKIRLICWQAVSKFISGVFGSLKSDEDIQYFWYFHTSALFWKDVLTFFLQLDYNVGQSSYKWLGTRGCQAPKMTKVRLQ